MRDEPITSRPYDDPESISSHEAVQALVPLPSRPPIKLRLRRRRRDLGGRFALNDNEG